MNKESESGKAVLKAVREAAPVIKPATLWIVLDALVKENPSHADVIIRWAFEKDCERKFGNIPAKFRKESFPGLGPED